MHHAFIGLGSNLDAPEQQIQRACTALQQLAQVTLQGCSSLYRNPALLPKTNPEPQPDYVNAVAHINTELSALALLHALQTIEQTQGRQKNYRWGPRRIDLDLLLYDQHMIHTP